MFDIKDNEDTKKTAPAIWRALRSGAVAGTLVFCLALTGCGDDEDELGDKVEDAGDEIEDVADDLGDNIEDIGDEIEDAKKEIEDGKN
jgi:hypothetical protein